MSSTSVASLLGFFSATNQQSLLVPDLASVFPVLVARCAYRTSSHPEFLPEVFCSSSPSRSFRLRLASGICPQLAAVNSGILCLIRTATLASTTSPHTHRPSATPTVDLVKHKRAAPLLWTSSDQQHRRTQDRVHIFVDKNSSDRSDDSLTPAIPPSSS
jgi:hypothetical protein